MASYVIGQHGAKRREQRRLTEMYGERVSGRTHESEHTIGFAPLNETSGTKRGGSKIIRQLEKDAWAYQEEKNHCIALISVQVPRTRLTSQALTAIPTERLSALWLSRVISVARFR